MKLSCDVIKDMLPLYAENMACTDTNALVEEHLGGCPRCRETLAQLQTPAVDVAQLETKNLDAVGKAIRRRRRNAVFFAVLATLTLLIGVFDLMVSPVYLEAEEAICSVELDEENRLVVCESNKVEHTAVSKHKVGDRGTVVNYISAGRLWRLLFPKDTGVYSHYHPAARVLTLTYGTEESWVWGEEGELNVVPDRSDYAIWIDMAAVIGCACVIAALLHKKGRKLLLCCGAAGLNAALAAMINLGFDPRNLVFFETDAQLPEYLAISAVLWVLLTATFAMGQYVFQKEN